MLLAIAIRGLPCFAADIATVLQENFDDGSPLVKWSGTATLEQGYRGGRALCIAAGIVSRPLEVSELKGRTVRLSAMVRGENVSSKPNPWNGIKYMLVIHTPEGTQYPQAPLGTGSFDWRATGFRVRIPGNATNITLVLGLEQVTGKVWFDDLKITAAPRKEPRAVTPVAGPPFKGHALPRLRGAMISPNLDAEGLRLLGGEWKANLIRFQLIRFARPGVGTKLEDYDAWLEGELTKLDRLLPECHKHGIMVALDLHSPPGGNGTVSGYVGSDAGLFTSRAAQDKFVEIWRKMAARYRSEPAIWGYDLANEPVEDDVAEDCDDWPALAERAAKSIREIDPVRAIIIEPANWGGPEALRDFQPIPVSNIVYSVHMYMPSAFTHQGVFGSSPPVTYPGMIQGKLWDKAQLEEALKPATDFQRRYNVHIYIGEFSAIRWAPDGSAYRYLRDVIDLFEKYGWDWSYHAFREWQGWSVEHGSDRKDEARSQTPTDRQQLLRDWYARNQKPDFEK